MAGEQQQVVLPSQAAQQSAAPVRGTPAHQQDLADDGETVDFAFEAFDAVTGGAQSVQQPAAQEVGGVEAPQQGAQQQAVQPQQQPGQQQPQVVVTPEPDFVLVPDVGGQQQQGVVVPVASAQQPVQQQAQAQQAAQAPVQQPAVAGVPQPVAAPAAATPPAQPVDPFEFVANQIAAQEQTFVKALAEKAYPITDEDYQAFLGGDSTKMSVFAARVHANVLASVMKAMSLNMPVVMNGLMQAHEENRRAEDTFFGTNKFLDRNSQQHRSAVAMAVKAVRGANPQADEATVAKMSGLMAAMSLGIDPATVMAQAQQARPQQPMQVRTPGPVVRQVPAAYVPAAPGGTPSGANGAAPALNEWDFTSRIIAAEEQGQFDPR